MQDGAPIIRTAREAFHRALVGSVLTLSSGIPTNADKSSKAIRAIAGGIFELLGNEEEKERLAGQASGKAFEDIVVAFLRQTFPHLAHLRPGKWEIAKPTGAGGIAQFEQYQHLIALDQAAKKDHELAAALGRDYLIRPDVVITPAPEPDSFINGNQPVVDATVSKYTRLRSSNDGKPILHASVSCKWTIRSDRAQNARTEAHNLIRNRKGNLPHIVVVTGEPLPSRLAAIALGTGDVD